jgi:hypothetical protein
VPDDPILAGASAQWSESLVLDTVIVPGTVNPRTCKPRSGMVQVCNAKYGFNGWLGIAQIWLSGTHITQGVNKLNDSYFNLSTYNTPAWRAMVTCDISDFLALAAEAIAANAEHAGIILVPPRPPALSRQVRRDTH